MSKEVNERLAEAIFRRESKIKKLQEEVKLLVTIQVGGDTPNPTPKIPELIGTASADLVSPFSREDLLLDLAAFGDAGATHEELLHEINLDRVNPIESTQLSSKISNILTSQKKLKRGKKRHLRRERLKGERGVVYQYFYRA